MNADAIRNSIFGVIAAAMVSNILLVYRLDERTTAMMQSIKTNQEFVGTLREKVSALEYSCKKAYR